MPKIIKRAAGKIIKMMRYNNYDSSQYWKSRAVEEGQKAVLWGNQKYNFLYRNIQRKILSEYISSMNEGDRVLDIGAGTGVVSNMLCEINNQIIVDAVDFEEMINVARSNAKYKQINYIKSAAEEFRQNDYKYNLILSSGCYSAIRSIDALEKSLDNAVRMLADDGIILMIDPFHRWNYLARAKYGTIDVVNFMNNRGLRLIRKSGVLFWPFREWLANSGMDDGKVEQRFYLGENILNIIGKHFWADYKILVFKR